MCEILSVTCSGVLISNFEYKKLKDQIVVKRYKIYLNKFYKF